MNKIKLFFSKLRFLYQKMTRGFSDEELWHLYAVITKWLIPRLVAYKKLDKTGYPGSLKSEEEWDYILDKIIWSFEYIVWDDSYDDRLGRKLGIGTFSDYLIAETKDGRNIYDERCKEGLGLFSEYFMALWD